MLVQSQDPLTKKLTKDALVPVVAAEVGVAGGLDLEDAFADLEHRHVEGAAAEIEHQHRLVRPFLSRP